MPLDSLSSVEKAVDVLFHLHSASAPLGVSAIGQALGMPKSSTHRLLSALSRRGLVEREGRGLYRPGMGLVALGIGVLDRDPVVTAARPILESFAERIGETFFLVGARAGQLVVLDKSEGSGFLRAAPRVGSFVPDHSTAVGKLYHAFAPELLRAEPEAGRARADAGVAPRRDSSAARGGDQPSAAFTSEVEGARDRGWASNRDQWIAGMSVLAAPVRTGGRLAGAVALAAASPRLEELGGDALASEVISAAERIGARLQGETT
jgi:DNA-binding IclR family transcriptional regulator